MIYITLLIYSLDGQEEILNQFEDLAIPIIGKYNGRLLLRTRPNNNTVIASNIETPYEIHLIEFKTEADFENFKKDEERRQFLHLKKASMKSSILIKGERM